MAIGEFKQKFWHREGIDYFVCHVGTYKGSNPPFDNWLPTIGQPQTKAEKNQARLKQLRGRAGRWC